MLDTNVLADNIKRYRIEAELKQFELAEKLHVSPQAISRWETGLSVPDVENLCALSDTLNVTVDALLQKEKEETLLIGVDGGGTKTEFVLFDNHGHIRRRIVLEGTNPNLYGMDRVCEILKMGIDSLLIFNTSGTEVTGIYCGIAGVLSGDNRKRMLEFLTNHYGRMKCECNSDIFNVSASATSSENCITVICGTGLSVTAIHGDGFKCIGGWGYLLEGKGSGFDIGKDALAAVLAMDDGIGPDTLLKQLIEEKLGTTVWNSIHHIYSENQSFIATFSIEVFRAYRMGDEVAKNIIKTNMKAITDKVNYLAKKFDCGDTVIISGGLTNEKEVLTDLIMPELAEGLKIVIPTLPQIFGACRCCGRKFGSLAEDFEENFIREYQQYQQKGNEHVKNGDAK